jgi:two-component system cell cycle sensor histidine kinase/response regulator CckA
MKLPRIMAFARPDSPLRVTLLYVLSGSFWIVGSDWWVAWRMGKSIELLKVDTLKGLLFIGATAGLLYFLIKRLERRHVAVEAELQESRLRWQFALEGAGDGLWDWNAETNRVFFSRQWKAMLGYAENEIGDALGEWEDRVHPDDLPHVRAELDRHWKGETPFYLSEQRVRMKDGTYKWILDRGQIISRAPDGRPRRMIGTHSDISVRKSAEARSADSLAFAQAVLHSSPVGVVAYAPDGRAVIANAAVARIIGTDMAGVLRQNFREIPSWREQGLLAAAERALATGQEVVHSGPYVSSFGRDLWLEVHFVPFNYSGEQHLLVLVTDETEQRRTLTNLKLMETAVLAAPVGWVVTDPEGVIQWVNPGFTTLTGYTAEEVIGRNPRVLKSGRHSPEFYATMWAAIKRGEVWTGEVFNQRKDGAQYQERMTIAPVRGENGAIAHYVAIKQDITGEKQLEQQLARAQRLEGIGMLASGIAHDLNNIFAPILLSLELLKLKYPMADARRMLDTIESAGQRGAGIVKQVLTFARGIEGERTEVQPKYLVKEMGQILGETLPRNIRVETDLAANLSPVLGDATQLHQVLLNLAINARDAMPVGGRLVLGARDVLVDESRAARNPPLKPGRCVALTVTDTGGGIPPEVLERMFEPFFTTKPIGKGTGLGLSTVYGIVRSHGGAVEVKTKVGEGTEFCVLLPAMSHGASDQETARPEAVSIQGEGRRILVVDDEETIRIVTAAALQRHGFAVETAEHGADGLVKFLRHPGYAAVVTDLMMPQMNGYEMAREIRRHDPRVPILASSGMTGDSGTSGPETGLAALGIKTLLIKPYAEDDLLRALAAELDPAPAEKKD